jgi:hypothetical protein
MFCAIEDTRMLKYVLLGYGRASNAMVRNVGIFSCFCFAIFCEF